MSFSRKFSSWRKRTLLVVELKHVLRDRDGNRIEKKKWTRYLRAFRHFVLLSDTKITVMVCRLKHVNEARRGSLQLFSPNSFHFSLGQTNDFHFSSFLEAFLATAKQKAQKFPHFYSHGVVVVTLESNDLSRTPIYRWAQGCQRVSVPTTVNQSEWFSNEKLEQ